MLLLFFVLACSQPLVTCRQCPGYMREMGQVLFATSSNFWFAGLPTLPPVQPPPKPACEEEAVKPGGEQPSTSSNQLSAGGEFRLGVIFSV